jgi:peptidoglycan hydrolase-like protein with peptidoglycan-binding domain
MNLLKKIVSGATLGALLFLSFSPAPAAAAPPNSYNFNSVNQLGTSFVEGGSTEDVYTQTETGGLTNSGAVDVSENTPAVYITTNSYDLPVSSGDTLSTSAYFKYERPEAGGDNGYAILGFVASSTASNDGSGYGVESVTPNLGVRVDASGYLYPSRDDSWLNIVEFPNLIPGQWYKLVLALEHTGVADTYDVHTQVWSSDENGELYALRSWHTEEDVLSESLAENADEAGFVHAYVGGQAGNYQVFSTMDNFAVSAADLAPLWDGSGTEESPYLVTSCAELQAINNDHDTDEVRHFKLANDIDCSDTENWNGGEGFIPIGQDNKWGDFNGVFDGDYKTISDLTIDRSQTDYQGLFDELNGATVRNLLLVTPTIIGNNNVGALAGQAYNSSTVERVGAEDVAIEGNTDVGGLLGRLMNVDTILRESYALGGTVTVTGTYDYGGGLVGQTGDNGSIEDSYAAVTVQGDNDTVLGGLAGYTDTGFFTRNYSTGSVDGGDNATVGGLLGGHSSSEFTVEDSFASGGTLSATASDDIGGLVGKWGDTDSSVLNNYYFNTSDLACVGNNWGDFAGEDCTEVESADHFKSIANEPLDTWDVAETEDESYNINSGYPVLAWRALMAPSETVWYLFASSTEEEPAPEVRRSSGGGRTVSCTPSRTTFCGSAAPQTQTESTSPAAPATVARDLQVGSSGEDVRMLQKFLNAKGYTIAPAGPGSPGNETNLFGAFTRTALAKFQAANGITPASGNLGPITRAFIAAMGAATQTEVPVPAPAETPATPQAVRDLTMGMQGNDVTALQKLLMAEGYAIPAGATGYFAGQTRDALAQYQSKYGIVPAIGYFGAATRAEMKLRGVGGVWW